MKSGLSVVLIALLLSGVAVIVNSQESSLEASGPVKEFKKSVPRAIVQPAPEPAPVPEVQPAPEKETPEMETTHYKVKNYRASYLADTVRLMLSPNGTMHSNDDLNLIIITDTESNIDSIQDMLKEIDKLPQQVIIQARVLQVNDTLAKDNGINVASIFDNSYINAGYDRDFDAGKTNVIYDKYTENVDYDYGDTEATLNGYNTGTKQLELDINKSVTGSLTYQDVTKLMNFLITNGYAKMVSEPKIVTINNRTGKVFIGDRVKIIKDINNYGGNVYMGDEKSYLTEEAGLILEVTPHIGGNDYITMDIKTGFGNIKHTSTSYVSSEVSEAVSSVIVRSGTPIVIGGYTSKEENITKYKFPVLGDIPVVKKFFSKKEKDVDEIEMVMILIPELVEAGEGFKQEVEKEEKKEEKKKEKK